MPKIVKTEEAKRSAYFKVIYPQTDTAITRWASSQNNISLSLRLLIKAFVAQNGCIDVTSMGVEELYELFTEDKIKGKSKKAKSKEAVVEEKKPAEPEPVVQKGSTAENVQAALQRRTAMSSNETSDMLASMLQ